MDRDRNLLFGVLAVQLRKVTPTQLVDIAGAWATDPSRSLGERLLEAGVLSPEDKTLLDGLVTQAITSFDGDASRTLEAFGGEEEVYHSFRGSVAMTDSGGIKSVAVTKHDEMAAREPEELGDIPAVEEMPSRYTYINEYGRGGMGRVLLVHDEILGRDLALKELLPHLAQDGQDNKLTPVRMAMPLIARFLQEARITGQLEHPSIVPVYELGHRKDGTLYYTMKLVRGKTLHNAIHECKNLEERLKLLPHFVDLCNAIAYAHKHGVIHRDIKPMNVMIGEFGETVVLDWGLAKIKNKKDIHADAMQETIKALNLGDDMPSGKTRYGDILGTPVYMPPEQAKGDLNAIDERSDIYSLGAVLYEILTGNPPFGAQNVMQTIYQVINETPKSIVSQERRCPPDLIKFCNGAMEKQPEKRYQKAKELADAVEGSKLRPPKSRIKKYLQRAAIFLIVFIPCCTVGLNIKSERDLANLKAYYEAQGIDMSGNMWRGDNDVNYATIKPLNDIDPLGAIYALEWKFPAYWAREPMDKISPDYFHLDQLSPHAFNIKEDDISNMRLLTERYKDVIYEIRNIVQLPGISISRELQHLLMKGRNFWDAPLPDSSGLRICANLLYYQAILSFHDGQHEDAIIDCTDIIRLADHFNESQFLFAVMIRVSLIDIGFTALQNIISHTDLTDRTSVELKKTLELSIDKQFISYAYQGELDFLIELFRTIRTQPSTLFKGKLPLSNSYLLYLGSILYGSPLLRFWLSYDEFKCVDYMAQTIISTKNPFLVGQEKRGSLIEAIGDLNHHPINQIRYPLFTNISLPLMVPVYFARAESQLKMALLALAIKQYQKDHTLLPDMLDALVPNYITFIPEDPFTSKPFAYQQDKDGYALYSGGLDGKCGKAHRYELLRKAVQKYKEIRGSYPESWKDMIPEYINEIPLDFMTGKSLDFSLIPIVSKETGEISNFDIKTPYDSFGNDDIVWVGR